MTMATRTKIGESRSDLNISTISPSDLKAVLLADGWHDVSNCEFTQFAVGPSASPPQPNKLYPAIQYQDVKSGRYVVTPLNHVLGFSSSESR